MSIKHDLLNPNLFCCVKSRRKDSSHFSLHRMSLAHVTPRAACLRLCLSAVCASSAWLVLACLFGGDLCVFVCLFDYLREGFCVVVVFVRVCVCLFCVIVCVFDALYFFV